MFYVVYTSACGIYIIYDMYECSCVCLTCGAYEQVWGVCVYSMWHRRVCGGCVSVCVCMTCVQALRASTCADRPALNSLMLAQRRPHAAGPTSRQARSKS